MVGDSSLPVASATSQVPAIGTIPGLSQTIAATYPSVKAGGVEIQVANLEGRVIALEAAVQRLMEVAEHGE